jgi:hypothetical protein
MTPVITRPYAGPNDLAAILAFVRAVRLPERLFEFPGPADLQEALARAEIQRRTRLWVADERLLAYAYVDPFHNLRFDLESAFEEELGPQIVAWGIDCLREVHEQDASVTLDSSCSEDYRDRIDFLKRYGFEEIP